MKALKIFEKFAEESDPIYDLGIGFNTPMDFDSKSNLYQYLISIIPLILKTNEIPDYILNSQGYINDRIYSEVQNYIDNFITYQGGPEYSFEKNNTYQWPYHIRQILLKKGFKPRQYFDEDQIKK
jgi:hypothetical protein